MPGSSFHFALTPVLQLRDRTVEAAQSALGRAVRARLQGEAALAEAEHALQERLSNEATVARTVRQLGGIALHRERLARAVEAARHTVARLRDAEQRAQKELAEAVREREALVTLRAEAAADHRTQMMRAETAVLDDLALTARSSRPLAQAA